MTRQPNWKFIAQLGDTHPIDYGGVFVYEDTTGVYPPEVEVLEEPSDDVVKKDEDAVWQLERELDRQFDREFPEGTNDQREAYIKENLKYEPLSRWTVYRFILEPCTWTDISKDQDESEMVLSDNKFHPRLPAWFAGTERERLERPQDTTHLKDLCDTMDLEVEEFVRMICHGDICERAQAWKLVGDYHGMENLDHYPLELTREEVEKRYEDELQKPIKRAI